jgi:hypothetical protein
MHQCKCGAYAFCPVHTHANCCYVYTELADLFTIKTAEFLLTASTYHAGNMVTTASYMAEGRRFPKGE